MLKNLDLAIDNALWEGTQVLNKYDSLDFYLKNIGFGHLITFHAVQSKADKSNMNNEVITDQKDAKTKRKSLGMILNSGTINIDEDEP